MNTVNFNGQVFPSSTPLFLENNRAFNYGDGLFETMRFREGKILFLERHWNRLRQSMEMLHMQWEKEFGIDHFQQECLKICPENGDFRLRFTAWRAGTGLYTPNRHDTHFLISGNQLSSSPYPFNQEGMHLHLFEDKAIHADAYSRLKSCNALPYILASIAKQKANWDECLLLNTEGRIAEASNANIFLIKGDQLLSPPLSEGGIAGIIREVLLAVANQAGFRVQEKSLTESDLLSAEEVFLSNSIQGIKWVGRYKNSTFEYTKSKQLSALLSSVSRSSK